MSVTNPSISIGLPVYNGANYIERAIQSILAQTYTDFELVITDNCSTDETEAICRAYMAKDARVKYHRNKSNIGASNNYNRCFELSKGRFFKWMAHDDEHAPTYLEKTVKLLQDNPDAVIAHSYNQMIDCNSEIIDIPVDTQKVTVLDSEGALVSVGTDSRDRKLDSDRMSDRFQGIILQTKWCYEIFGLMRRSALASTHLQESFYGTDKVLLAEMALKGRILHVPEPLFLSRHHPEQSSQMTTSETRETWNNPRAKKHHPLPQFLCLQGYYRAVRQVPMQLTDRTRCLSALALYVSDVGAWSRLVNEKTSHVFS